MLHAAAQTLSADAPFSPSEESSSLQKENVMSAHPSAAQPASLAEVQTDAILGVVRTRLKSARQSALDRAIAAAEASLPDLQRLSRLHDEAGAALDKIDHPSLEEREAARVMVLMPSELAIAVPPSEAMTRITMEYGDGRIEEKVVRDTSFRAHHRGELAAYCERKGLDADKYLGLWDDWKTAQDAAEQSIIPAAWTKAEEAYEKAEAAWGGALDRTARLAKNILRVKVSTPADALRQMDAYARVLEKADLTEPVTDADQKRLYEAAVRALKASAAEARRSSRSVPACPLAKLADRFVVVERERNALDERSDLTEGEREREEALEYELRSIREEALQQIAISKKGLAFQLAVAAGQVEQACATTDLSNEDDIKPLQRVMATAISMLGAPVDQNVTDYFFVPSERPVLAAQQMAA